jgi:hypothetical protein
MTNNPFNNGLNHPIHSKCRVYLDYSTPWSAKEANFNTNLLCSKHSIILSAFLHCIFRGSIDEVNFLKQLELLTRRDSSHLLPSSLLYIERCISLCDWLLPNQYQPTRSRGGSCLLLCTLDIDIYKISFCIRYCSALIHL